MRLGTRLVLSLGATVTVVMLLYGWVALRQRASLLRAGLVRETETLARTIQVVTDNALRDGRYEDLARVLGRIADDPETIVAAVVDSTGLIVAGTPSDALDCFPAPGAAPSVTPADEVHGGWRPCRGEMVRWATLPLREPGTRLLIGRRETVVQADMAASRVRILLTTLLLGSAASLAILLVLRSSVTVPLDRIMDGARSLGGPVPPAAVQVPRSAGEFRDLAEAFNEMAARLEGKRQALVREVDERVALEGKLRRAEKFAALGRLIGGLAHELGSPLNAMAIRAEAIEAHPDVPEEGRRHAREIVAQVDRVADLVRSFRHISRGQQVQTALVDVRTVVEGTLSDLRPDIEDARVDVRWDPPSGSILVRADATLLRHALAHLVRNALQALGEVEGPRSLRLAVMGGEEGVDVVVEDNGPGVPLEARARLFEPFFTTRDVGAGTGLGLAISLGIAEEHGGSVRLDERGQGGVRAILTLPLPEAPQREAAAE